MWCFCKPASVSFWAFFPNSKCSYLEESIVGRYWKAGRWQHKLQQHRGTGDAEQGLSQHRDTSPDTPGSWTVKQIQSSSQGSASFPPHPAEVKAVRGVHRKVCVYTALWSEKFMKFKKQTTAICSYTDEKPGNCQSVFLVGFPHLYYPQQQLDTMDMHWIYQACAVKKVLRTSGSHLWGLKRVAETAWQMPVNVLLEV